MILTKEANSPSLIGGVHILHVADGLDRLMGNRALYLQMLRRFRQHYPAAMAPIRAALVQDDAEHALQLIHTLKGAAGLIGALHLYQLVLTLEAAVEQGQGHTQGQTQGDINFAEMLEPQLHQLQVALHSLLGVLDRVLEVAPDTRPQSKPAAPALDDLASKQLLLQLAQLLADGDGAAIDVLEQSAGVLAASLGVAVFEEMAAAAHRFDFMAALEKLEPAMQEKIAD